MSTVTQGRVVDPTAGTRIKRWWLWAVGLGLLLALALSVVNRGESIPLDARNPKPVGARALAEVLGRHGVTVTPIDRRGTLAAHQPSGPTTLVVFDNLNLTPPAAEVVADVASRYTNVVVAGASQEVIDALELPVDIIYAGSSQPVTGCADPMVGQTRSVSLTGRSLVPHDEMSGCFGSEDTGYLLATRPATPGHPRIDVHALADAFSNQDILANDDALLALRLLSRTPSLVWFAPSSAEFGDGATPSKPPSYLPEWYDPVLVLGIITAAATMLWRGRRLGRLVVEPLPVTIRTTETTRSRGRLYNAAADRQNSLAILQKGTRRRLAKRLSVPPGASESVLVAAVAGVSGWPSQHVADLLFSVADVGDEGFVARANALTKLEEECR